MDSYKICYLGRSKYLEHPADRRRLIYWANKRKHKITTDLDGEYDVIFLTESANFNQVLNLRKSTPVIFELIDSYLTPNSNSSDYARGIFKILNGEQSGPYNSFSKQLINVISKSNAVVCSNVEQGSKITQFNSNNHPILDFHEEFPFFEIENREILDITPNFFWEGLTFTLKNLRIIENSIPLKNSPLIDSFTVITDDWYPLIKQNNFKISTRNYIRYRLPKINGKGIIYPWSVKNVSTYAQESKIALLPLDLTKKMNQHKAENRLLIMWRLGLPVLASPSLGYSRVLNSIESNDGFGLCDNSEEWWEMMINANFYKTQFTSQILNGQKYLKENHSEEAILKKWDLLFESVLK